MEAPASEKVHRIPAKETGKVVRFVPQREKDLIAKVTQQTKHIEPFFTEEQATPPAAWPIKGSEALDRVRAERVGEEPAISQADIKHFVDTSGTMFGGVNPDTFDRTIPGGKVISFVRKRAKALSNKRYNQQNKKAA